ncbi:MAG: MMPL family transporter, partial [Candidatus Methanomethylophilaceae archaeon]|nr:MMPL family transporter [Candidatus Methanomethylophilaceae archaeon]
MTRDINLRYVDETYDENGLLKTYKVHYPDDFNFGYDIVDDIAINDPQRRALVWCDDKGHEKVFTFADIKRMSDKTANYLTQHGVKKGDMVLCVLKHNYQFWYVSIAVVLSAIVLALTMDSWMAPVLFLLTIGMSIIYNLGTNFIQGEISFVTMSLTAVLQLAVTMDYSIF